MRTKLEQKTAYMGHFYLGLSQDNGTKAPGQNEICRLNHASRWLYLHLEAKLPSVWQYEEVTDRRYCRI